MDLPSESETDDEEERHHGYVEDENAPTLEEKVKVWSTLSRNVPLSP